MTPKKDIETEINKYLKGNYSKKVAFELLKREGFTAEELQPFSKHFDTLHNNSDNSLSFFPGFLFLLLSSLLLLTLSLKSETLFTQLVLLFIFALSVVATYYYHKKNKLGVLFAGFQNVLFILIAVYLYTIEFIGLSKLLLVEFWLLFTLFSIKKYYTKIKQD
ncbi:hypothetical protein RF683_02535 [Flavobacterium sp. 20NA77.7]|uniref:DUF1700 domain-containing protein n=1 Tax=Flavobacterium nakdongensis TaxID=3073563 RepID=A0ABY9RCE8_9FLAO|nr:hypothetical protein [Flavobacterium sp. 20NA77.7]WMW78339.1 hypothetical protein RF683_02535 [Flavobacterium sp. 20NA77.7]